jgi:hypothetical protein
MLPPPPSTAARSTDQFVDRIVAAIDRRQVMAKRAPYPRAAGGRYREPNKVHECVSIDVLGSLRRGATLTPESMERLGAELGEDVERVGKKCYVRVGAHQVFFYPHGRIECLKTATVVDGLRTLKTVFSRMARCGCYFEPGATFDSSRPALKRALFDAKLGFPVNLREFRRFMVERLGEPRGTMWFPAVQRDRVKWVPSFDPDSTVQMYSTGSVNYFIHHNAKDPDSNRDDVLVARYTSLHRYIAACAVAAMVGYCQECVMGTNLGLLPLRMGVL